MKNLPTGTVTFLFTDIEGSTTLLQRLGDRRYAEVLEEHHRLLRVAFIESHGQEIETQGDGILVVFPRARDAVAAAVAAQRAITRYAWPQDAAPRVRMGLHTGEPLTGIGGYVGLDVHRAARICGAGHGGQILLSDVTQVLVAEDLPEGINLRDLGEHQLRDLADPQRLFQVTAADLLVDFPPLRSFGSLLHHNLPSQLTSFIGRECEITAVRTTLASARLVTLTGAGGSGKTRLALRVAVDLLGQWSDGVWLVELASITDGALVPQAFATTLGVSEQVRRPLTATLTDYLASKSVLLVVDNCEHVLADCAQLANALLRACPALRILATSREPLGIDGEVLYPVPALSVPDPERLPSMEDLIQYESVRLFRERATAVLQSFTVNAQNGKAVAQVCHHLDGIPLAIELAAVWVKTLAVEQIVTRLGDRFRLLTKGTRTAPSRHQTLEAAMDWSYQLLSETERVLLRRLSVFAGGWTLEAAEAVCTGGSVETDTILDLLTALVDKSLVFVEMQHSEARYGLLETVRQYARDRLVEAGEEADVRTRHRTWCVTLAELAEPEIRGPRQRVWRRRLETERDNLRAALVWGREDPRGAGALLRLVGALNWYWWFQGNWREALGWCEEAVNRRGDVLSTVVPKVYWGASQYAWRFGDRERAKRLNTEGLAFARELGDKKGSAFLLVNLGIAALDEASHGEAAERFAEAVRLARQAEDKWLVSICLSQQGHLARFQGDLRRAKALHEEALALIREAGDIAMMCYTFRCLGLVAIQQSDFQSAAKLFAEGLSLSHETGFRWMTVECLDGLAGVSSAHGRYGRASRLFGAAERLRQAIGHRPTPQDQDNYDRRLASARSGLGDVAFAAAWAEGRAMTLEQAIEYALASEAG